jgi:preprotein translocase subunit Sss1
MSNGQLEPNLKWALDLACSEMDYRRKKQWDIFAWVVTILVSVIGGVIVLSSKEEFKPDIGSRIAMAGALAALTAYAYFWIDQNITAETQAYQAIVKLVGNDKGEVDAIKEPSKFSFGYVAVVLLIGIVAVGTVGFVNLLGSLRGH